MHAKPSIGSWNGFGLNRFITLNGSTLRSRMRLAMWMGAIVPTMAWWSGAAHAAITVFDASGTFADGASLSGTLTIDTTAGQVTASDLVVGSPDNTTQTNVVGQGQGIYAPNTYGVDDRNASSTEDFNFVIPDGTSLVNYSGGSGNNGNLYNLVTSTIGSAISNFKLAPAPTPRVINVEFNSMSDGPYTGQGALVTSDAHIWNHEWIPALTSFVDSTGASTSITVSANSDGFYTPGSWTGNNLLDQTQTVTFGSTKSFTIGGLATNARYNLYLYGWNQQGFKTSPTSYGGGFDITSGAGSNTNPQTTSGAELVSGTDYTSSTVSTSALGKAYIEYSGLIPNSSGQITGTYNYVFNGFQLQELASAVFGVPIVSFTAAGPVANYGVQITNGTGTDQGAFSPNTPTANALNVVGSHGSYKVATVTAIDGTAGAGADSVEATGFSAGDTEIFAVDVLVNGTQANGSQITTLVNAINNGDSQIGASAGVVASASSPVPDPFGSQYNLFIDATDMVGGGTDWLGLNLTASNDSNLVGYTFSAIAVVPEPCTLGLLGLGAIGLLARRSARANPLV